MWVVGLQHKSSVTQNNNAHDTEQHYFSCLLPSTSATTTTTLSSAPSTSYPITNTQLPLKSSKSPQFNYRHCRLTSTNKHASNNKQYPSHSHKVVNLLSPLSSASSSTSLNTISTTVPSTSLSAISSPTLLIADTNDATSTMIHDRHHLNTQQTMNKLTTDDINVKRASWSTTLNTKLNRLETTLNTHIQNFKKLKNINRKPERYITIYGLSFCLI